MCVCVSIVAQIERGSSGLLYWEQMCRDDEAFQGWLWSSSQAVGVRAGLAQAMPGLCRAMPCHVCVFLGTFHSVLVRLVDTIFDNPAMWWFCIPSFRVSVCDFLW